MTSVVGVSWRVEQSEKAPSYMPESLNTFSHSFEKLFSDNHNKARPSVQSKLLVSVEDHGSVVLVD